MSALQCCLVYGDDTDHAEGPAGFDEKCLAKLLPSRRHAMPVKNYWVLIRITDILSP